MSQQDAEVDVPQQLRDAAQRYDVALDELVERCDEWTEEYRDRAKISFDDEKLRSMAAANIVNELKKERRVPGKDVELSVLAVGQRGVIEGWGQDDDAVVYSHGVVHGEIGSDGQEKASRAIMINKADHVDLGTVRREFYALNTLEATYSVQDSDDLDVKICWSTPDTELVEADETPFDGDYEERLAGVQRAFDEASLATLAEDRSAYDPDDGWPYDFGADLKWIEGTIVDCYVADDRSTGRYTIVDDSVTEEDLEQSEIVDTGRGTPGLTVWAGDPDYHMERGEQSRCVFLGVLRPDDDGIYQLDLAGVVDLIPMPIDDGDEDAAAGVDASEEVI